MEKITFEIVTLDWKIVSYKEVEKTTGIYQIYGTSPLYGMDTLLYIGKSTDINKRLSDHIDSFEGMGVIGRQPNKSYRVAQLQEDLLDIVEQTLIVMHKPSFNSARLINLSPLAKGRAIYIQNHGNRGLLNTEVTNFYFLP